MGEPMIVSREDLEPRLRDFLQHPTCRAIRRAAAGTPCHLVGGALRDRALGRSSRDLDVVVAGRGGAVAHRLAHRVDGRAIAVGGERFAAYRVVSATGEIDLWDRADNSIESDMRRRDLTVHSFALDLDSGALIDPFSGIDDLLARRLRATTETSFSDDPLRLLRLARFAAQLPGFEIEPRTRLLAWRVVDRLTTVASERLQREIEWTLNLPRPAAAVALWLESATLPDILLQRPTDETTRDRLRAAVPTACDRLRRLFASPPAPSDPRAAYLALVLRSLEEPLELSLTETVASLRRRGLVTRRRAEAVSRILRCGPLPDNDPARRWFLYRAGDLWPEALAVAAAHQEESGRWPSRALELATIEAEAIFDPPALVSGDDLQRHLGIAAGPQIGRLLSELRRRQIEGEITTRSQALETAEGLRE